MTRKNSDYLDSFKELRSILSKYEKHLIVTSNNTSAYNLNAGYSEKFKKEIYFGGVFINKNYISFHLIPVYVNTKLLDDISPELRKRMHGKSCFNFKLIDKKLFKELSNLTNKGFEFYKVNGML